MFTAKEVGGDFYDFFFIDENHLLVIIADVSGKGIPAALFMMTLKPLIRGYAEAGLSAAEVFTKTNSRLCESSDSKMFVTAFMGILDTQTGIFTYVNAGHNPPLIRRKETGFVFIKPRPGLVLAAVETIEYKQVEIQMFPNDMLFLYTDGVTESLNPALELFSEDRLLKALNKIPSDASPAEVLIHIKADVDEFSQNATQADDITMLGLEYKALQLNTFSLDKSLCKIISSALDENVHVDYLWIERPYRGNGSCFLPCLSSARIRANLKKTRGTYCWQTSLPIYPLIKLPPLFTRGLH